MIYCLYSSVSWYCLAFCFVDGNICQLSESEMTHQAFITQPGYPNYTDNIQISCSCEIWLNPGKSVDVYASLMRSYSTSNDCNATLTVEIATNETTEILSCRDALNVNCTDYQGISSNVTVNFHQLISNTGCQYGVIVYIWSFDDDGK